LSGASEAWMMLSRVKYTWIFLPQRTSHKKKKSNQYQKRGNKRSKEPNFLRQIMKLRDPENQEKVTQRSINKSLRKIMKWRDPKNQDKVTQRIVDKY
jgi:hypothetical protein